MNKKQGRLIKCLNCQKEFRITDFYFNKKKCCSKKCKTEYLTGKPNLKLSIKRKKLINDGQIKIWNDGLTNKTDERVKKNSIKAGISRRGRKPWNKDLTKENNNSLKIISLKQLGINNPNYKGGTCFSPYDNKFTKEFKKEIKKRDNYICQICKQKKPLHIHHIDYNKLNSTLSNCISLCIRCHGLTGFNRESWIKYFKEMITKK